VPALRLAFLGPRGTFTEQAALLYAPDAELIAAPSIADVTQLVIAGQADEAIRVSQRGLRLNAHGLSVWLNLDVLAFSYFVAGRYPEAVEASRRLIEMRPDYLWGYLHLAASFARLDRPDEARSALEEALRVQPDRLSDVIRITLAFGDPTVVERYTEALRKAGLEA